MNGTYIEQQGFIHSGEATKEDVFQLACENIKNNPLSALAWFKLAEVLRYNRHDEEADRVYRRAWLLDPAGTWIRQIQSLGFIKERYIEHEQDSVEQQENDASSILIASDKISEWGKTIDSLLDVPKSTVTAAIIMKDAERTIERCIQSVIPAVDEIVIVDTGSCDRSIQLAENLGVKVYRSEWKDDFSEARNVALQHVISDWVLWIDSDEYLDANDTECPRTVAGFCSMLQVHSPVLARVPQINQLDHGIQVEYNQVRFFANDGRITYKGRVHEQPVPIHPEPCIYPQVRIRLHHDGYLTETVKDKNKMERNIALLRKDIQDDPDEPGIWGLLGRELLFAKQIEEAIRALEKAEQLSIHNPNYVRLPEVRQHLINAYMVSDRIDLALKVSERAVQGSSDFPNAWYQHAQVQLSNAIQNLRLAHQAFIKAKQVAVNYRGWVSADPEIQEWKADAGIADILRLSGSSGKAYQIYNEVAQRIPEHPAIQSQLERIQSEYEQLKKIFET